MAGIRSITEQQLRDWVERDQRRADLERQARQLKKENDLILESIEQTLDAAGKAELVRGAFRAAFEAGRGSVSWKDEFVRRHGAEEAQALIDAAEPTRKLRIVAVMEGAK